MGGCCCCLTRRSEQDSQPIYLYCPRNLNSHEPLSSQSIPSAVSAGMLVATNLYTTSPDTYIAPPLPVPYNTDSNRPQAAQVDCENSTEKNDQVRQSDLHAMGNTIVDDEMKRLGVQKYTCMEDVSMKAPKSEVLDSSLACIDEQDECPICLEEYDLEDPRILTKCEHHFHLACILEWMERSVNCPVCDKITIFDHDLTS